MRPLSELHKRLWLRANPKSRRGCEFGCDSAHRESINVWKMPGILSHHAPGPNWTTEGASNTKMAFYHPNVEIWIAWVEMPFEYAAMHEIANIVGKILPFHGSTGMNWPEWCAHGGRHLGPPSSSPSTPGAPGRRHGNRGIRDGGRGRLEMVEEAGGAAWGSPRSRRTGPPGDGRDGGRGRLENFEGTDGAAWKILRGGRGRLEAA